LNKTPFRPMALLPTPGTIARRPIFGKFDSVQNRQRFLSEYTGGGIFSTGKEEGNKMLQYMSLPGLSP